MNVPRSVIHGKSPMKTDCSRISPVSRLTKETSTESGREYVWPFSLHSARVCVSSPNSSSPNSTARLPV
ncbi:unannotated protein [freshwater metagenome]|uniref:Unannotated protein n=1 Tax=freshwater metagenome TaxID=449393 RepID=A0A6J7IPJ2_9ZZZZ